MLSPGEFHKRVPKDRGGNLRFRRNLLAACRGSRRLQAAAREACRLDCLFYLNAFCWTYNPRKKGGGEVLPFVTWDFQDEAVRQILWCIEHDEDLLIEKSREMGASWLCLYVMEWLWHFRPWQKFLCISRSEAAVEDDDPDSLFWKIDFVHRHLPGWLLPGGSKEGVRRRKLFFGNAANDSTITGQASTGRAGVGGRATAMFIDEFSQIKEDFDVLHRTSDTTGCRIFNGTHLGTGTAFHELSQRVDMRKLQMHWSQHPDKRRGLYRFNAAAGQVDVLDKQYRYPPDFAFVMSEAPAGGPFPGLRSPWYDRECQRKGSPRAIAMDLDIDPGGSVAQFFNPLTIRTLAAEYGRDPFWEGDVEYDRDSGRPVRLIPNPGGPVKLWLNLTAAGLPPRGRYGAGCDVATGLGATNSCLSVVSAATGEKVLEYATPHLQPEHFAPVATALCWLFKDERGEPALFAWEHAGPGMILGKRVLQMGYGHIYYREAHATLAGGKVSDIPGWYPSNDQKRILLEEYRAALDARRFVNRSTQALRECLAYRYTPQGTVEHPQDSGGEDPTGARVNHGDRVIADALAWKMAQRLGIISTGKTEPERESVGSLAWRRQLAAAAEVDPWA